MRGTEPYRDFAPQSEDFTFQLSLSLGLLKEGGNISPKKSSWAGKKQELRSQKPEVRIENYRVSYILSSVFCLLCLSKTTSVLVCGKSIIHNYFEGGLLCLKN